jgi:hypothetical protein
LMCASFLVDSKPASQVKAGIKQATLTSHRTSRELM